MGVFEKLLIICEIVSKNKENIYRHKQLCIKKNVSFLTFQDAFHEACLHFCSSHKILDFFRTEIN
jgi:hypothetical protein